MNKISCKRTISKIIRGIIALTLTMVFTSCEEWLTVPAPDTELVRENIFDDNATALAALTGIYDQLTQSTASFSHGALSINEGAYADELTSFAPANSTSQVPLFYFNSIVPSNSFVGSTWSSCYAIIYSANQIIEGLNSSNKVSVNIKNQILGEALFLRAFCHFYLVNLYGDVPLITVSDYRVSANASRTSETQVYARVIADLLEAKELLTDTYPSMGRVRANRGTATALLARTYLYISDFANAEAQATEIINKEDQYKLLADLNSVFLKTSEEAIWQLLPNGGMDSYTYEGFTFILVAAPPTGVTLRNELFDTFEANDLRKTSWVGSLTSSSGHTKWYYPLKYKENHLNATGSEYSMVLRLSEQYLIRAEARALQDKLTDAQADLNTIRNRAGLEDTEPSTKEDLLTAIEHERKVELFTEWGHRFFDLKRTGRLDAVLKPVKLNWQSHYALLPLPQSEILINQNLTQNHGY